MKNILDNELVEVVIRKKITYKEYLKIIESTKRRGWSIQAYKIGFYSDGLNESVKV